MKLTKEKCDKALEYARSHYYPPYAETMGLYEDFEVTEEYQVLEQLIKEHFDNEPLNFEEIESQMIIFDKSYWCWIEVEYTTENRSNGAQRIYGRCFGSGDVYSIKFEEGRFFRKQVEE